MINFRFYDGDKITLECFASDFDDAVEQYYKINEAILACDPKMYGNTFDRNLIKQPSKVENCQNGVVKCFQKL